MASSLHRRAGCGPHHAVGDAVGLYEPWVRLALNSPPWSEEKLRRAEALRSSALHLGEVAETMKCSVFEVQAELGIGRRRDVRAYRRIRASNLSDGTERAIALVGERA